MEGVTEGRIVHFVLKNGEYRPAIIVNSWPKVQEYQQTGRVNLQVFTDFENDRSVDEAAESGQLWRTSVLYDPDGSTGTWHWIEKA